MPFIQSEDVDPELDGQPATIERQLKDLKRSIASINVQKGRIETQMDREAKKLK